MLESKLFSCSQVFSVVEWVEETCLRIVGVTHPSGLQDDTEIYQYSQPTGGFTCCQNASAYWNTWNRRADSVIGRQGIYKLSAWEKQPTLLQLRFPEGQLLSLYWEELHKFNLKSTNFTLCTVRYWWELAIVLFHLSLFKLKCEFLLSKTTWKYIKGQLPQNS